LVELVTDFERFVCFDKVANYEFLLKVFNALLALEKGEHTLARLDLLFKLRAHQLSVARHVFGSAALDRCH